MIPIQDEREGEGMHGQDLTIETWVFRPRRGCVPKG
jgi:hypothetical protein